MTLASGLASVALATLTLFAASIGRAASPYEVVDAQLPMCQRLVVDLQRNHVTSPMSCKRVLNLRDSDFSTPKWIPLGDGDALQAALALERARAERGPPDQVASRFQKAKIRIEASADSGRLKAWEANLDIAQSGQPVRTALVSAGECDDVYVGVLLPHRFEVDPIYRNLAHWSGDIVLYRGVPFIAQWTTYPTATLARRVPPKKGHMYYLLIQSIYWLEQFGSAGVKDTVCQIGYERIRNAREH